MTVTASSYARVQNDLYQTEPWATRQVDRFLPIAGRRFWEPSAGNHLIVDTLREMGAAQVIASDIALYDHPHHIWNFFTTECIPDGIDIFTNPPYGKQNHVAAQYARHALQVCPNGYVVLLLTMKFDSGSTRVDLIRDNPRFAAKITLVDRLCLIPGTNASGGTEDHAWFIWRPINAPRAKPIMLWAGKW